MSSPRVRKVADRIKVVVAEMLERRIKDPRLGFVTITEVRVSGDTQHATVFYTVLGGPEEISLSEVESQLATDTADREPLVKQDLLAMPLREAREHFERAYLQQQLLLCGGKVGQLAKRVGMERTHLYRKLRSLGVDFRQSLTDD